MPSTETLFVLSVDTEEEWQWNDPFPAHHCSVKNVQYLPSFQQFCDRLGIRPTYFVDYPVLDDSTALAQFKKTIEDRNCEVGGHLHPWCNPPYFGETTEEKSHVVNLPIGQVKAKLDRLMDKTNDTLGMRMKSFRTGRWGIDEGVINLLIERGFDVDSSVYPLYRNDYFSCMDAPLTPYFPDLNNPNQVGQQRTLMEIPVTVGFNRSNHELWRNIHHKAEQAPWSYLRSVALMWHTGICKKIYLSPELSSLNQMKQLIDSSIKNNHQVIHMFLHSSSLLDNANGFYRESDAFNSMCSAIENTLSYLQSRTNVTFTTISEASQLLRLRQVSQSTQQQEYINAY